MINQNDIISIETKNTVVKPYRLDETLKAMDAINFVGHIIPHTWKSFITFENGKPDLLGMMILSDIVYWYRPTVKRSEQTGNIIGYQKKFYADKLHCNISAIAKQNGVSYRQAFDALKRLENKGLIEKETRVVETSYGTNGNVLYVNPVVEAIRKITELPQDLPECTQIDAEPDFIPAPPLCNELHKGNSMEEHPLCNRLHKGLQSITSPHVIDRHVTKITTKTTSKNTAAEASNDINGKSEYFFAAAAVKKENKKNTFNNEIINQPPKAESLITEGLTEQQKIYLDRQLSMLNFDDLTTQRLAKEIEAGLIDPHCFIKTGNDFYRKINAIIKSVKIGQWTPPASLQQRHYEEKEKQTNQKQREIHALWLAWNQAINHVYSLKRDLAAAKTAAYYPALVQQHDQAASHLKAVQAQILMHCPDTNFNQIQKEVEEKFYA